MIRCLDPGHRYVLLTLDGDLEQTLTFVKRCGPNFPGNADSYQGTTLQSVLRACLDRLTYLQGQIPCEENVAIARNLQDCLFLLEHRAMRRHRLMASTLTQHAARFDPMCPECGHVRCECKDFPRQTASS